MPEKQKRTLIDILLGREPERHAKEQGTQQGMRRARHKERWTPVADSQRSIRNTRATKQASKDQEFVVHQSGQRISSIAELRAVVPELSDEQFRYHTQDHGNDFAAWVQDVFGERTLSHMLARCGSRAEMTEILKRFCNAKPKNV